MSAAEIIEQIKRLPPEERQQVRAFLSSDNGSSDESVAYIPRQDLERTATEIFKQHETLFRKLAE